nr:hypothetical protein CFP56_75590 [Quercus suber]
MGNGKESRSEVSQCDLSWVSTTPTHQLIKRLSPNIRKKSPEVRRESDTAMRELPLRKSRDYTKEKTPSPKQSTSTSTTSTLKPHESSGTRDSSSSWETYSSEATSIVEARDPAFLDDGHVFEDDPVRSPSQFPSLLQSASRKETPHSYMVNATPQSPTPGGPRAIRPKHDDDGRRTAPVSTAPRSRKSRVANELRAARKRQSEAP